METFTKKVENNFVYWLDYNYEKVEHSDDWYIYFEDVTCSNVTIASLLRTYIKWITKKLTKLDIFCIDKVLYINGVYDYLNYTPKVGAWYYGDEIIETTFNNLQNTLSDIDFLLNLSTDREKLEYTLRLIWYTEETLPEYENIEVKKLSLNNIVADSDIVETIGYDSLENPFDYIMWIVLQDKVIKSKYYLLDWLDRYNWLFYNKKYNNKKIYYITLN